MLLTLTILSVWVCFCCGLWWFVNIPIVNMIIILHYMWVVGIDGCAPMNMTMVKNDMKNKGRERFSGNFQVILFMTKRQFFLTSSFDHLKIFLEKHSRKTGSSYLVATEKQPNCFFWYTNHNGAKRNLELQKNLETACNFTRFYQYF